MTQRTVLLVTADESLRATVAAALDVHSYKVLTAASFADGRKRLVEVQPDVLVTSVRLQEHNGLHLAIVGRMSSAVTKTIVIGYADRVLESEAHQIGAVYLADPDVHQIVSAIEELVPRPERRWPRARTNIAARAGDRTVTVVDLSYGGFRLELEPGSLLGDGERFDLTVGDLRVAALPVWVRNEPVEHRQWCGAAVAEHEQSSPAWRHFVDQAMGHAIQ